MAPAVFNMMRQVKVVLKWLIVLTIVFFMSACLMKNRSHPDFARQGSHEHGVFALSKNSQVQVFKLPPKLEPQSLLIDPKTKARTRILCWILTGVPNHMTRAIHVKRTWGLRCDILLFMSSQRDERLGTIALPGVEEGHDKLWPKTVKAFQYIWEHHRDEADWIMKADDDTWVFVDNLRSLLRSYNQNEAHFIGRRGATTHTNATYNYGGTGYVLSRQALRLFIEESLPYPERCYPQIRREFHGWEDAEFGECMRSIGVLPENILDDRDRHRMLTYNPAEYLVAVPEYGKWKKVSLFQSTNVVHDQFPGIYSFNSLTRKWPLKY